MIRHTVSFLCEELMGIAEGLKFAGCDRNFIRGCDSIPGLSF
jgi:hypothetical protein